MVSGWNASFCVKRVVSRCHCNEISVEDSPASSWTAWRAVETGVSRGRCHGDCLIFNVCPAQQHVMYPVTENGAWLSGALQLASCVTATTSHSHGWCRAESHPKCIKTQSQTQNQGSDVLCLRCAFYLLSIYPHGLSCLCYVVSFF